MHSGAAMEQTLELEVLCIVAAKEQKFIEAIANERGLNMH